MVRTYINGKASKPPLVVEEAAMKLNLARGPSKAGNIDTTPYLLKCNQECKIKRTTNEIKSAQNLEG
jgi:hypothetical protein